MRNFLKSALVALSVMAAASAAQAHDYKVGDLVIDHPWSRATPGGADVGVGYITVVNKGDAPDRLIGGSTPVAENVEVHSMTMEGDMMKMRKLDGLEVPAGGSVTLKPGGYHLMLIGLKKPLEEGKPFTATLNFEKAGKVDVEFKVEGIGAPAMKHMDHGDMGHGDMDHGQMDHGDHMDQNAD